MDVKWWLLRAVMMRQLCQLAGSAGGGLIASDMCCSWVEATASDQWMNDNQMSIEARLEGRSLPPTKPSMLKGVFQGSILRPLLYNLYINCFVVLEDEDAKLNLYAYDNQTSIRCWSKSQASHDTLPTSQMKKWWMWCKKLHLSHPLHHSYKNSVIDFLIASGWISMSY